MSSQQAREVVETYQLAGLQETSAKTGLNVELAFRDFAQVLLQKERDKPSELPTVPQKLEAKTSLQKGKKKCC